jgi:hypothetical protein
VRGGSLANDTLVAVQVSKALRKMLRASGGAGFLRHSRDLQLHGTPTGIGCEPVDASWVPDDWRHLEGRRSAVSPGSTRVKGFKSSRGSTDDARPPSPTNTQGLPASLRRAHERRF